LIPLFITMVVVRLNQAIGVPSLASRSLITAGIDCIPRPRTCAFLLTVRDTPAALLRLMPIAGPDPSPAFSTGLAF
jgi:hypothetical protein